MSEAEQHAIDRLLAEAPVLQQLPADSEWEMIETRLAADALEKLTPFAE